MFSHKLTRSIAVGAAAIAVAIGAYAFGNSSSSNGTSGSANAATLTRPGQGPRAFGQGPPPGFGTGTGPRPGFGTGTAPNQTVVGTVPQGWQPGSGTVITGSAADQAKAVALAKYPGGTVNRVLQLSDGSYAVHMIKISFPHHVFVSTSFQVTGAIG
ncbi:MAG: hypothetical protein QOJ31_2037 [Gaiellales bacterium]|jgi:hypothetical protein|nr:hypothetical protein [Gaiellales bacterium]MDX6551353.1 hypothetical protein [Gaiellales bacterium]